jgi:signal transduction histidine kinase
MADALDRGAAYETEFRLLGFDAGERWIMAKGKAQRNGKPLRMLGVFVDFTERHQVEADLRELGGRLINAHEQERRRLARELHDDVGQMAALFGIELELLRQQLGKVTPRVDEQIARLFGHAGELGSRLHRLSHELHPTRLEHLGLEASIRSVCEELASARRIALDLEISKVSAGLGSDAALCLYRIAQESLHNIVRHSGATRVKVTLAVVDGEVILRVVDDGVGFDVRSVDQKDALGLVSMRERARLVRGQLTVTSRPGDGTSVEVRLPRRSRAPSPEPRE